jgi:hypothetical protein
MAISCRKASSGFPRALMKTSTCLGLRSVSKDMKTTLVLETWKRVRADGWGLKAGNCD